MTIVVGVAAPDGLVLAADSRSTRVYHGTNHHRIATDSAQKVFSICSRYGVAAYGASFIGRSTIAGVMDEFVAEIGDKVPTGILEFADALGGFFHERLMRSGEDLDGEGQLGFLVGGYGSDDGLGRFLDVQVPGSPDSVPPREFDIHDLEVSTDSLGVVPFGMTQAWTRLVAGVDWDLLSASGIEVHEDLRTTLDKFEYNLIFPITLQDAIEYADFVIRTTVDIGRFSNGTGLKPGSLDACGGVPRVLAVIPNDVIWISGAGLSLPARLRSAPRRLEGP